jgi:phosphoglucosamine mutase
MRADLGVMISASHNPYYDNGIKLFGPDGFKLSDEDEKRSRRCWTRIMALAAPKDIGRARRIEDARGRYIHAVKRTLPDESAARWPAHRRRLRQRRRLSGRARRLWELGAEVIAIGVEPNGKNINDKVRLHPSDRCQGNGAWRVAPTSASRSMATPTG